MRIQKRYGDRLDEITNRLTAIRTLSPDGRPGFSSGEYSLLMSVMESAIDFNPAIPHADRPSLVREAVTGAAKESVLTAVSLQKFLASAERKYLRAPLKQFVLATALGVRGYHGLKTLRINGVRISFAVSLPRKYDRGPIADRVDEVASHVPADIVQVLARVSARTSHAAFYQAQSSVDLIRALWNLVLNYGKYSLIMLPNAPAKPINAILPGSLHTLHLPDGVVVEEIFWLELQVLKRDWIFIADDKWPDVQKRANKLLSRLRSIKYRAEMENALVRYVRALDEADPRSSFNRIWSVLEFVTDSVGDYDRLIRRASFLSQDRERTLVRMLLQHLRDVRNAIVHEDDERPNIQTYLEQVKLVTERLIMFHLRNGKRFESRAAAVDYLDTPVDNDAVRRRMRDYRRALLRKW